MKKKLVEKFKKEETKEPEVEKGWEKNEDGEIVISGKVQTIK